jgi:hypothetical protein
MEYLNIERLQKEGLTIELLITRKCNFYCGHCMYDCSPFEDSKYMPNDILKKVKQQVDFLKELGIKPVINIIGGEPTLDLDKFEYIFNLIQTWNVNVTVSTNGWWLKSEETTDRFFSIFRPYLSPLWTYQSITGNYIIVRISDDKYHQSQRILKNIPEPLDVYSYMARKNLFIDKHCFIVWQNGFTEAYWIFPNGRGEKISQLKDIYKQFNINGSYCFTDVSGTKIIENGGFAPFNDNFEIGFIHYNPDGLIEDGCKYGSIYDVGTVDDNILFSMMLINKYKTDRFNCGKKYNCYNCRTMFKTWKKKNLKNARKELEYYNSFEIERFVNE